MDSKKTVFAGIVFMLFSFFLFSTPLYSAGYDIQEGYIIHPVELPSGIVFTDEYESTVYFYSNGKTEQLFSSPGCGRYLNFSSDGNLIGFKYISETTGMQQSALYNLTTGKTEYLTEPSINAGQVSFSDDGKIAFTIENKLFVKTGNNVAAYDLGYFNNRATISPDGLQVVYKDKSEQLFLLDLVTGTSRQVTNMQDGLGNVDWSFDSQYLAFETIDANIYMLALNSGTTKFISEGEEPKWANNELAFAFYKKDINFDEYELVNSDIYLFDVNNEELNNLTNTPEVKEITPTFKGNGIVYSTYFDREVVKIEKNTKSKTSLLSLQEALKPDFFPDYAGVPSATEDLPDYVHIHQVYDTKQSWDQGRVCCGATSAMEVIASYEILDPAPFSTYGHITEYGYYISEPYSYNGSTYSGYTGRWSSGGHGYLWNTSSIYGSSPYSNTKSYLEKHGIVASRADYISWSMVENEMNLEYPYILCSTGLTSGHIVVAVGLYGSGHTLYLNDPYGDKNAGNYGYVRNGKNAIYDWSDANTGHQKVTPVVWAVKAHYEYRMKLRDVYPENNASELSCSLEMIFKFDKAVDPASLQDKIILSDENGNEFPVTVNQQLLAEGLVCVEPAEMLAPYGYYSIVVKAGVKNINGNPLKDDIIRNFKTGADVVPDGPVINSFDNVNDWLDVDSNPLTNGVNYTNTGFEISGDRSYEGDFSGKLNYEATGTDFTVKLEAGTRIYLNNQKDYSFAIAIYGDLSGNEVTLYLEDEAGTKYPFLLDYLDYTGWKVKFIPFTQVPFEGNVYFNGVAVKSAPNSSVNGTVYFDMLKAGKTPTVILSHYPADKQGEIPVNEKLTISFNKKMDVETLQPALNIIPATQGNYTWSDDSTEFYFEPADGWLGKTAYRIELDTTARDANGVPVYSTYGFEFSTERIELLLMDNYPQDGMTELSRTVEIQILFDGAIDQSTLSGRVFLYDENNQKLGVRVNTGVYSEGKLIFEPQKQLNRNAEYRVILNEGIKDIGGLEFKYNKEIKFRTETSEVVSGNVVDDLDNYNNWKQPSESVFSYGIDNDKTQVTVQSMKKVEGYSAIQLDYQFTADSALCVLYNNNKPNVGADGEFGMWIFGDRSGNTIQYFVSSTDDHFVDVDVIDWTGWKFKSINLGDYSSGNDKALFWVAVKKEVHGSNAGRLYIDAVQNNVVTGLENDESIPTVFSLEQNYPNPFNPSTKISFSLPETGIVRLEIYNILGEKVNTLVNREMKAGVHEVEFNASAFSSGVYFYRIESGNFSSVRKMMLLK